VSGRCGKDEQQEGESETAEETGRAKD
jgi:hypothetical protein